MVRLYDYQLDAVERMKNGCILCGNVGSGKSRTALAYYILKVCKGGLPINDVGELKKAKTPTDLYIITTAKKRDNLEWENEMVPFNIYRDKENSWWGVNVVIDSWNNIKKYKDVTDAFFMFDEQRVVGSGTWVKTFLRICKRNKWILLSATPGDKWDDYRAVFIANGFFLNKTEFERKHCVFSPFMNYKKVERYVNTGILCKYRRDILVMMKSHVTTVRHHIVVMTTYNKELYKCIWKDRWNIFDDEPIAEQGKLGYLLRRVVNSDPNRIMELTKLLENNPKTIIFYNFKYELEIIKEVCNNMMIPYSEWNGDRHQDILKEKEQWAYLVQYAAGAEGWNCIDTNVVIFYSQNYSYKTTEQASGRIDRINTPFTDLYYYHIRSSAPIDIAIKRALETKQNFNEKAFLQQK